MHRDEDRIPGLWLAWFCNIYKNQCENSIVGHQNCRFYWRSARHLQVSSLTEFQLSKQWWDHRFRIGLCGKTCGYVLRLFDPQLVSNTTSSKLFWQIYYLRLSLHLKSYLHDSTNRKFYQVITFSHKLEKKNLFLVLWLSKINWSLQP